MRKGLIAMIGAAMLLAGCSTLDGTADGGGSGATSTNQQQQALHNGLQALKGGNLLDAERHFASVLKLKPNDPFANLNMGLVKSQMNRIDEAIAHYKIAIAKGENIPARSQIVGAGGTGTPSVVNTDSTVAEIARGNIQRLGA